MDPIKSVVLRASNTVPLVRQFWSDMQTLHSSNVNEGYWCTSLLDDPQNDIKNLWGG